MKNIERDLKDRYDVVVVGSGPAGASAAKALDQSGLKVVIIEKCSLPRDKMCCGMVLPSARKFVSDNFGHIPDNVMCEPWEVRGIRMFITNDSPWVEVPILAWDTGEDLPEYAFNVYRSGFDLWLCNRSDASLADNSLFVDYRMDGKDIVVKVKQGSRYTEMKTKYLIGADGPQSRVRRSVSPTFDQSLTWLPTYEEHYEGKVNLEPGWLYAFLDREVTGFMASVYYKGKNIQVTTSGIKGGESSKKYYERFVEVMKEKHGLRIDRTVMKRGIVMNDMAGKNNYNLGNGSVLLAGEAAGFLRGPDGITPALITGKAAGESIRRSIRSGSTPLECYADHESVISEKEACGRMHRDMVANLGLDIFSRK
jgi:flavin-dependent dehydrogenase